MRLLRLGIVCLPWVLGLSGVLPGRAQEVLPDRFAFADTTLLRDTLGIHFHRLFQLADSLRMPPDSLRAVSIRYRFPPLRMVALADSLGMPVDSVGPYLARERYSPFAALPSKLSNRFSYGSGYTVQETRTSWINTSDYGLSWAQVFLNNVTSVQLDRFLSGGQTTLRQDRTSTTEAGWRIHPEYSVGARAVLSRFDSDDPSSISTVGETRNEFQFSLRSRQNPLAGVSSEINAFSGVLDFRNSRQDKRGLTNELNGRVRYASGAWFLHEVNGRMTGNFARTRAALTGVTENTRDVIGGLTGTLSLFEGGTYSVGSTYGYQNSRVGQPDDLGQIQNVLSTNASADATLRAHFTQVTSISLTGQLSKTDQVTALSGPTSRRSRGWSADGRLGWSGWALEGRFRSSFGRGEIPQATSTGGYGEDQTSHALDGALTRRLFTRLSMRMTANINLAQYRYWVIGSYGTPPVSRDQLQHGYRIDGLYTFSPTFNSGVSLDVSRVQLVNIPSASTSANNTQRLYRAEWRWTYRLMQNLTATQSNRIGATYTAYQFVGQNDRLVLDYAMSTTLNAIITPRLSLDVSHFSQVTPSGNYTQHTDGLYYLRRADETRSLSLNTRVSYIPTPGLSLTLEPFYRSAERSGTQNGVATTTRVDNSLNFQGNVNLNIPVGRKGQLTGSVGRTYFASRGTPYLAGLPQPAPASETDFWIGALNLSWHL